MGIVGIERLDVINDDYAPVPVPCSVEMEHMIFRVEVIVLMSATLLIASAFRTRQLRLVSRIRPLVYHDSCRLALQFFLLDFRYLALRKLALQTRGALTGDKGCFPMRYC